MGAYGQPTEIVTPGSSWWLGKSREELRKEAEARATAMGKTAIGRTVPGRINTP